MLGHRLRRWPNIVPPLGERLAFAGSPMVHCKCNHFHKVDTFRKFSQGMLFERVHFVTTGIIHF